MIRAWKVSARGNRARFPLAPGAKLQLPEQQLVPSRHGLVPATSERKPTARFPLALPFAHAALGNGPLLRLTGVIECQCRRHSPASLWVG